MRGVDEVDRSLKTGIKAVKENILEKIVDGLWKDQVVWRTKFHVPASSNNVGNEL